ncbi:MAG: hypothetical protein KAH38_02515 [Candidatus Hydrogenedentes bacterium]|nr:hypothetical protein [Candidatus Hydrogenedentota bacterium]
MKRMIMVVLALVVLAGCATTGEHRDPYGEQVQCSTCERWYDGVMKSDVEEPDGKKTPKNVCAECGRVLPEKENFGFLGLGKLDEVERIGKVIVYGGLALVIAVFALALG